MSERFNGKVVMITGAGNGLAKAAALAFAAEGAALSLVDVDEAGLKTTQQKAQQLGARVQIQTVNLSSRQACQQVVAEAVNHFGQLDVLCNIAGIVRMHPVTEVTEEQWQQLVAINMAAPFWLSQAAIPELLKTQGNIVNCASQSAFKGSAYIVPYSMTKGAVVMLTKSMAMEFINQPIRINAVSPGTMNNTNMTAGMSIPEDIDATLFMRYSGIRTPAEPEDVASMFLYLASADARAVHGAIVAVDGGTTAD